MGHKFYTEESIRKECLTPTGRIKKNVVNDEYKMSTLVMLSPSSYKILPPEMQNNAQVLETVAKHARDVISQYFNETNKNDRDLILKCCENNDGNFQYASTELRADKEFIKDVLKLNKGGSFIKWMDNQLKRDVEFLNELLDIRPDFNICHYCHVTDPQLAARAVSGNSYAKDYLSSDLLKSKEFKEAKRNLVYYVKGHKATPTGHEKIQAGPFKNKEEADAYADRERKVIYAPYYTHCLVYGKQPSFEKDQPKTLQGLLAGAKDQKESMKSDHEKPTSKSKGQEL